MAPNPLHAVVLLIPYFKRPLAFDPLALIASSVAVDAEVIYTYFAGLASPHLFLHSFAVALTIYPVAISLLVYAIERRIGHRLAMVYRAVGFEGKVSYGFKTILGCSFLGGLSHMLIDMWTHPSSPYILWPFAYLPSNPFYLGEWSYAVDAIVVILSAYSLYLWAERWRATRVRSA